MRKNSKSFQEQLTRCHSVGQLTMLVRDFPEQKDSVFNDAMSRFSKIVALPAYLDSFVQLFSEEKYKRSILEKVPRKFVRSIDDVEALISLFSEYKADILARAVKDFDVLVQYPHDFRSFIRLFNERLPGAVFEAAMNSFENLAIKHKGFAIYIKAFPARKTEIFRAWFRHHYNAIDGAAESIKSFVSSLKVLVSRAPIIDKDTIFFVAQRATYDFPQLAETLLDGIYEVFPAKMGDRDKAHFDSIITCLPDVGSLVELFPRKKIFDAAIQNLKKIAGSVSLLEDFVKLFPEPGYRKAIFDAVVADFGSFFHFSQIRNRNNRISADAGPLRRLITLFPNYKTEIFHAWLRVGKDIRGIYAIELLVGLFPKCREAIFNAVMPNFKGIVGSVFSLKGFVDLFPEPVYRETIFDAVMTDFENLFPYTSFYVEFVKSIVRLFSEKRETIFNAAIQNLKKIVDTPSNLENFVCLFPEPAYRKAIFDAALPDFGSLFRFRFSQIRNANNRISADAGPLRRLISLFPNYKTEIFHAWLRVVKDIRDIYGIELLVHLFPKCREAIFNAVMLNFKGIVCSFSSVKDFVYLFPESVYRETIFDAVMTDFENLFHRYTRFDIRGVEDLVCFFRNRKTEIFHACLRVGMVIENIDDFKLMVRRFPEQKEAIFSVAEAHLGNIIRCCYDIKWFVELFPRKRETIFNVAMQDLKGITGTISSLKDFVNLFPGKRETIFNVAMRDLKGITGTISSLKGFVNLFPEPAYRKIVFDAVIADFRNFFNSSRDLQYYGKHEARLVKDLFVLFPDCKTETFHAWLPGQVIKDLRSVRSLINLFSEEKEIIFRAAMQNLKGIAGNPSSLEKFVHLFPEPAFREATFGAMMTDFGDFYRFFGVGTEFIKLLVVLFPNCETKIFHACLEVDNVMRSIHDVSLLAGLFPEQREVIFAKMKTQFRPARRAAILEEVISGSRNHFPDMRLHTEVIRCLFALFPNCGTEIFHAWLRALKQGVYHHRRFLLSNEDSVFLRPLKQLVQTPGRLNVRKEIFIPVLTAIANVFPDKAEYLLDKLLKALPEKRDDKHNHRAFIKLQRAFLPDRPGQKSYFDEFFPVQCGVPPIQEIKRCARQFPECKEKLFAAVMLRFKEFIWFRPKRERWAIRERERWELGDFVAFFGETQAQRENIYIVAMRHFDKLIGVHTRLANFIALFPEHQEDIFDATLANLKILAYDDRGLESLVRLFPEHAENIYQALMDNLTDVVNLAANFLESFVRAFPRRKEAIYLVAMSRFNEIVFNTEGLSTFVKLFESNHLADIFEAVIVNFVFSIALLFELFPARKITILRRLYQCGFDEAPSEVERPGHFFDLHEGLLDELPEDRSTLFMTGVLILGQYFSAEQRTGMSERFFGMYPEYAEGRAVFDSLFRALEFATAQPGRLTGGASHNVVQCLIIILIAIKEKNPEPIKRLIAKVRVKKPSHKIDRSTFRKLFVFVNQIIVHDFVKNDPEVFRCMNELSELLGSKQVPSLLQCCALFYERNPDKIPEGRSTFVGSDASLTSFDVGLFCNESCRRIDLLDSPRIDRPELN